MFIFFVQAKKMNNIKKEKVFSGSQVNAKKGKQFLLHIAVTLVAPRIN